MMRVEVLPAGIVLDVLPDETIMAAAQRLGYWWPTTCGGAAECGLCAFVPESGAEHLSPMMPEEEGMLAIIAPTLGKAGRDARLACQTQVFGDVVLVKRGVRPDAP
jgi:2Fe-2S ferredoxin